MFYRSGKSFRTLLRTCAAGVIAFFLPNPALADVVIVAQPISPWEIEYADNHCGLKRHFANGEHVFSLELRQFAPRNGTEVTLFSNSLDRRGRKPVVRLGPDGKPTELKMFMRLKSGEWDGVSLQLPDDFFGALSGDSNRLYFAQVLAREVALELGAASSALKALDACVDDLVKGWGLNPGEQRRLSRNISNESIDWKAAFAFVDDVRDNRRLENGATTRILFLIDTTGRAMTCKILGDQTEPEKVKKACEKFQRKTKFEPALDADGRPVSSFVIAQLTVMR